jgi:hypothetical protein
MAIQIGSRTGLASRLRQGLRNGKVIYVLALGALLAGIGWWLASHTDILSWNRDEGTYLMWAQLTRSGYPLYSVVWADQLPAFIYSIRLALEALGPSLSGMRLVPITYSLLGLAGVAWTVRELHGSRLASLVAVGILFVMPDFFRLSRAIMADIPSMSVATLSLAAALHCLNTGRRVWLAVSGALLTLALAIKVIVAPIILPLGLILLAMWWKEGRSSLRESSLRIGAIVRGIGRDGLIFAGGLVLAAVLILAWVDITDMVEQSIKTYFGAREAYPLDIASQFRDLIWPYLFGAFQGLTALALFGLVALVRRDRRAALIAGSWWGIFLLALATHTPLWPDHQLALLLFPMSALAGIAIGELVGLLIGAVLHFNPFSNRERVRWSSQQVPRIFMQIAWLIVGCIAFVLFLNNVPSIVEADQKLVSPKKSKQTLEFIRQVKKLTQPDDFLLTDRPLIAFMAGRLVPPSMVDMSGKRARSGELSDADMVATAEKYQPQAIALLTFDLTDYPNFRHWMDEYYEAKRVGAGDRIYLRVEPATVEP